MKKLVLVALAILCVGIHDADAKGKRRKKRKRKSSSMTLEVGLNPLGYFWGNYNANAGLIFSDQTALFLEVAYNRTKFADGGLDSNGNKIDVIFGGFSIAPEFRYYFNPNDKADKWFIGAYLKYENATTSGAPYLGIDQNDDPVFYDITANGFGGGLTLGYQWVFDNNLCITAWGGTGYFFVYNEKKDPDFVPSTDPLAATFSSVVQTVNRIDGRGGITVSYRF